MQLKTEDDLNKADEIWLVNAVYKKPWKNALSTPISIHCWLFTYPNEVAAFDNYWEAYKWWKQHQR